MIRVRPYVFTLLALLGVSLAPRSAQAATELFLQFDPVLHGSGKETTHPKWIVVDSYEVAADARAPMAAATGAAERGTRPSKITFSTSDLSVMPELREAVAKGTHYKMAVLDVKKTGKAPSGEYLKITMADVIVTSAGVRAGATQAKANGATFTLVFEKEQVEYSTADGSGNRSAPQAPPATWNVATAKAE
jgi:type VI protein secretion system component Hcp